MRDGSAVDGDADRDFEDFVRANGHALADYVRAGHEVGNEADDVLHDASSGCCRSGAYSVLPEQLHAPRAPRATAPPRATAALNPLADREPFAQPIFPLRGVVVRQHTSAELE